MANNLENIRHSLAHLLAMAVLKEFPEAKLGVGPVIENGFYYDFLLPESFTPAHLKKFKAAMKKLASQNLGFEKEIWPIEKARAYYKDQPFKLELITEKSDGQAVQVYKTADFIDFCKGGHVANTKEINAKAFALTSVAGAYWKGDERREQMQRVYGVAFETPGELAAYLKQVEEAKKRDHRKIGAALKIFTFDDDVGPGLPLWLPNGAVMVEELEKLAKETEQAAGYLRVRTPHLAKESLYLQSGHLPYYAESMFPPMVEADGAKYYLKPMNCPHHHKIYAAEPRSYRDLPLRLAEYGTCYRYEKSGELFGLMRVRSLQMNDAHIYCALEQFEPEFMAVVQIYLKYFELFGINKYVMRLSTHAPDKLGQKYVNEPKLWQETEALVREALTKHKINFIEVADEAAFYGPKIDVLIWSAIGREFALATNQVDFSQPRRFNLTYKTTDGREETPLVIHRAPLGTHERLIGFLIEHYAGAFPTWLAPRQAAVIPVAEATLEYAQKVEAALKAAGTRAELLEPTETLGKRVRTAEQQKIPYLLVVGEKEAAAGTVSVRTRGSKDLGRQALDQFLAKIKAEIAERRA